MAINTSSSKGVLIPFVLALAAVACAPETSKSKRATEQLDSAHEMLLSNQYDLPPGIPEAVLNGSPASGSADSNGVFALVSTKGKKAQLRFPNHGEINALVVFIQHKDDTYEHCASSSDLSGANYSFCASRTPGYESWTDDPETEWPANLPLSSDGRTRDLPRWANRVIDPPGRPAASLTPGSLSDFYQRNSLGKFGIRGVVYPRTYVPKMNSSEYLKSAPFENGAVKLSHELISYIKENPRGIDFDDSTFDRYINGTNELGQDGIFDMIILVYRFSHFRQLYGAKVDPKASAITSLGAHVWGNEFPQEDKFQSSPLQLGKMRVIDNLYSGSGILTNGFTLSSALACITHELGHRQFGYYHTASDQGIIGDSRSVMDGGKMWTGSMGASDRLKLGWAEPVVIDLNNAPQTQNIELEDSLASGKVLYIQNSRPLVGDLIIEARLQNNWWSSPPNGLNNDGDAGDSYLANEGLLIYKMGLSGMRFADSDYSSLDNQGEEKRLSIHRKGTKPAFGPGDSYGPLTQIRYYFFQKPDLDQRVGINEITLTERGVRFKLWKDFLAAPSLEPKVLGPNSTLELGASMARPGSTTLPIEGVLRFDQGIVGSHKVTLNTSWSKLRMRQDSRIEIRGQAKIESLSFEAPAGESWQGLRLLAGSATALGQVTLTGVAGARAAIEANGAALRIRNSRIEASGTSGIQAKVSRVIVQGSSIKVTDGTASHAAIDASNASHITLTHSGDGQGSKLMAPVLLKTASSAQVMANGSANAGNQFCQTQAGYAVEADAMSSIYARSNSWNIVPRGKGSSLSSPSYSFGSVELGPYRVDPQTCEF